MNFGTLILVHEVLKFHYLIAASLGFVFGLIVVYIISSRYVFGESKIKSKSAEFALFTLIGLGGLLLLNGLLWIFTDLFGLYYLLSKIVQQSLCTFGIFARRKLYNN